MILIDIGNTSLHFGIEENNHLINNFRVYNKDLSLKLLKKVLNGYSRDKMIICSVAPSVTACFKKLYNKLGRPTGRICLIGKDIVTPVKSFYNKKEIGQDRLVNAFAAKELYPEVKIVVDFGTTITIDFLSKKNDYLGGFILPGIKLYLNSLSQCELLSSSIALVPDTSFIPKNTAQSISRGVKEGFSLMLNAFVNKYRKIIEKQQNKKIKVIITGGQSNILRRRLNFSYIYEPLLTLKGLLLLGKKQFTKNKV